MRQEIFVFNAPALLACLALSGCGGGSNGRDGADGAPGPGMLVRTVAEPAGIHCAAGGQMLQFGADVGGNGELDDAEVRETRYVCNGLSSRAAVQALPVAAGDARCASGGYLLRITGSDGSVMQDQVVCNGDSVAGPPGPPGIPAPGASPGGQFAYTQIIGRAILTCDSIGIEAGATTCSEPRVNGRYLLDLRRGAAADGLGTLCTAVTGAEDRSPRTEVTASFPDDTVFYAWDGYSWKIASHLFFTYGRLISISCTLPGPGAA